MLATACPLAESRPQNAGGASIRGPACFSSFTHRVQLFVVAVLLSQMQDLRLKRSDRKIKARQHFRIFRSTRLSAEMPANGLDVRKSRQLGIPVAGKCRQLCLRDLGSEPPLAKCEGLFNVPRHRILKLFLLLSQGRHGKGGLTEAVEGSSEIAEFKIGLFGSKGSSSKPPSLNDGGSRFV